MNELGKKWADIYNAFDPIEPVPLDKLDDWYVERPGSPLKRLLIDLAPEKLPQRMLLVGHRASGKSTELLRLSQEMEKKHGYFVVYIPLDRNADIEKVNPIEIVFLMGISLYKTAQESLENKPPEKHMKELKKDLETIVHTHTENKGFKIDIEDTLKNIACFALGGLAAAAAGPGAGMLAAAATRLLPRFGFSSGISTEIARKVEIEPQLELMVRHLNELISDIQGRNNFKLALIVDGLDKPEDARVVSLNFSEKRFLALVECRAVYAAPISVYYSPAFASTRGIFPPLVELPNIRLPERHGKQKGDSEGLKAMREIVEKRLRSLGLKSEEAITKGSLDLLIQASGGIVRDLIILMRDASSRAELSGKTTIDEEVAKKSIAALRRLYQAALIPRYREILRKVRDTHQRTDDPECDTLLKGNFILSYLNDDIWFDVHSIFREEDLT